MIIFKDRQDAGEVLARELEEYQGVENGVVLGIPRGGVVVGFYIANKLRLPLDVVVSRKIGDPRQKELALGAVDEDGEVVWDEERLEKLRLSKEGLMDIVYEERDEIKRREKVYRAGKDSLEVAGKIVILVDDGIATGETMLSAIRFLKRRGAKKVVAAVPLALSPKSMSLVSEADELVVPYVFDNSHPVAAYFQDFKPVSDEAVISLLE
jgi:putative phosphoribosyl transferase